VPTIIDGMGERELSDEQLARLDAEFERQWDAFWDTLVWRPIAEYPKAEHPVVLVRSGDEMAPAEHCGAPAEFSDDDTLIANNDTACWRAAGGAGNWAPLSFEPIEFAELDAEWRGRLMQM
jgi:hypothetical protein